MCVCVGVYLDTLSQDMMTDDGSTIKDEARRVLTVSADEAPKLRKVAADSTGIAILRETKLGDDVLMIVQCSDESAARLMENHGATLYHNGLKVRASEPY